MHKDDRWSPLLPADDEPAGRDYTVRAKVWRWKGDGGWHFVTLPVKQAGTKGVGVNKKVTPSKHATQQPVRVHPILDHFWG